MNENLVNALREAILHANKGMMPSADAVLLLRELAGTIARRRAKAGYCMTATGEVKPRA